MNDIKGISEILNTAVNEGCKVVLTIDKEAIGKEKILEMSRILSVFKKHQFGIDFEEADLNALLNEPDVNSISITLTKNFTGTSEMNNNSFAKNIGRYLIKIALGEKDNRADETINSRSHCSSGQCSPGGCQGGCHCH